MGVDIHMHIVDKTGKMIAENIINFRNTEWFDNLTGSNYTNAVYKTFPKKIGIPDDLALPEKIMLDYASGDYFDWFHLTVDEFERWYTKFKPFEEAGWVRKYDAWLYKKKDIAPDKDEVMKYLGDDDNVDDLEFIEIHYPEQPTHDILDSIWGNNAEPDSYIIYYFDC